MDGIRDALLLVATATLLWIVMSTVRYARLAASRAVRIEQR